MKMKRYSLVFLFLLLISMFAVFRMMENRLLVPKEDETEKKAIELEIWYPWTGRNELYEAAFMEAVEEYNEKHSDILLVPYGMEMELYREKLSADIASNETPDIYYCFTGGYMEQIIRSGRILRLDDYLPEASVDWEWKNRLSEMIFDENIYGLGFAKTVGVFLINEEIFEKYQIAVPETCEQLMEVCQLFLNYGITPLACSEDNDVGFRMYLEALCMYSAGADEYLDILTGKGEISDAFMRGVKQFVELLDMGAFGKVPVEKNTYDVEESFYMSRIPMYYTKNSFVGTILQRKSPLYGKIRAIPFPGADKRTLTGGVCDCFVVNAQTRYPKQSTQALWEVVLGFSERLHASGAGISIWEENGEIPERILQDGEGSRVYLDMTDLLRNAERFVPFWEFAVDRKQRKQYLEISRELFEQEIDTEEFERRLRSSLRS